MLDYVKLAMMITIFVVFAISFYTDLRFRRIPNLLCLVALILGLVLQLLHKGSAGLFEGLLCVGLAFIILFPFFALRALGAGDVKMMMAVASMMNIEFFLLTLGYGMVIGFFTSIAFALYKLGFKRLTAIVRHYIRCLYLRQFIASNDNEFMKLKVPYAPALAVGWVIACSQNTEVMMVVSALRYQVGI
ncbi:prepilin peptidase [Thalassotalea sp. HSM 43]|uniref:A24 family peptidase n=1 Tax=Thalassotalea sp. HSM 43 TaxID=2552945 RepID=UPI001081C976|nr:A24 family peptidase [Thalassotalea sp. HSM 43]QBY03442.1 prepilin peptidase [Thalassotalea sp. HSM 43]